MDEGYIKFNCHWKKETIFQEREVTALNHWRQKLYELNLVGAYDNGIGFGNVSQRYHKNQFIISGSTTGNLAQINVTHYALVQDFDIEKNKVLCAGLTKASSESMSHAVIYQTLPDVQAVFHIHHMKMWKKYLHQLPTTSKSAAYGTPEMAFEIQRLIKESDVCIPKIFMMAGHEEGIIAFGNTLDEAGEVILKWFEFM